MLVNVLLALLLFDQAKLSSPFNVFSSNVEPHRTAAECRLDDAAYFQNLTYEFHAKAYPGHRAIPFKGGRYEERPLPELGVDWSIELEGRQSIQLGRERGVLLSFFANHVGGSGSASHVIAMRCKESRLEVVFEAGGEGVRSSYANSRDLRITYPVWRDGDSHADPSEEIDERYRWEPNRDRFVLIRRTESRRPR